LSKERLLAHPLGDSAVTISFGTERSTEVLQQIQVAARAIEWARLPAVRDVVPAYLALTVFYDSLTTTYHEIAEQLLALTGKLPLRDARTAKLLYDKEIARWAIERGARLLADGSAVRDLPVGSDEWLESEVLSLRGEAVLLEPDELRHAIAARAKALAKELGVERLRVKA